MQFVHQPLTWAFLLALLPLLIHLINMMRHRRVKWAAMEFLLASYKKHRKWIWLKQLLLLMARIAAIALVVAMLAQLKTRDQWAAIFGGRVTHHYVVLDDSYSMSDRVAGASAMDAAKQVIGAIVDRAVQEDSPQKLTLIRYSRARGGLGAGQSELSTANASAADFNAEPIDANFDVTLERKLRTVDATQLAVGPLDALAVLRQLLVQTSDETRIVYVLSDYRRKDWESPAELRDALGLLRRSQAEVHLVNCARSAEPNLGIVAIEPAEETRAAGVPLFVNVKVKNFGAKGVSKVQLRLQSKFYAPDEVAKTPISAADTLKGQVDDLATLLIEQIAPLETVTRRVQVFFPQPGRHVVEASLPEDPVEADNRRFCVIDFPAGERVLIVDGSADEQNAYYLGAAFRPLERSNTGIQPDVKPAAFLRDVTAETLAGYTAIYLMDVPRLDGGAVKALETYVNGGGGLAIFAGPDINAAYYNQALYQEGRGILPAPLGAEAILPAALDPSEADIVLSNHSIFSFFQSETNPLIRGVKIDRYRAVAAGWRPTSQDAVEVIATTREKSPLVVSKKLGRGEVVLFLTSLAPRWNDWAKNPSFVVVVLKLQSYLASAQRPDDPRLVGTELSVSLESSRYLPELALVAPGQTTGTRQRVERQATAQMVGESADKPGPDQGDAVAQSVIGTIFGGPAGETGRAGVYEAWVRTTKGETEVRRWAFNVEPDEGDLATISWDDLSGRLDPVRVSYHVADQYQQDEVASSGYNLSMLMMGGLVLLLVGEQLLAYSASYHVTQGGSR